MSMRIWAMGRRRRGVILLTALLIAGILMAWAVAAISRVNFQAGATRFSYQRSEGYFLARTGISRALAKVNAGPTWLTTYTSVNNGDTSTNGTVCWAETGSAPNTYLLKCRADLGSHSEYLTIPIISRSASDAKFYSLAPPKGTGPDLISWSTMNSNTWNTLPPVPDANVTHLVSTAQTTSGDVFTIAQTVSGGTALWRYRDGQGWYQMPNWFDNGDPNPPTLSNLSAAGDNQIIARGSDNSLMILQLAGTPTNPSMEWTKVPAPSGVSLNNLAANPTGQPYSIATGTDTSGAPVISEYDQGSKSWVTIPAPTAASFDSTNGSLVSTGGNPPNYSGGVAVDKNGHVFVASNPPGQPSVIYQFQPSAVGSSTGTWNALAPLPGLSWAGANMSQMISTGYASDISHLRADDNGNLWAQWTDPATGEVSAISCSSSNVP